MQIRETTDADLNAILQIEHEAFKSNKEAEMVKSLLDDPTAKPLLSLIAIKDDKAAGHILFTAASLLNKPKIKVSFLAPLAILPDFQRHGIGGKLIRRGLQLLSESDVGLVFVVGHPEYYPRYGFSPAYKLGFETPHPISKEYADAWMVKALRPELIGKVLGKVICCDVLNKPENWQK